MDLQPKFEISEKRTFIGMSLEMSIVNNNTFKLFRQFMPRKKEVLNQKNKNVYDLVLYPKGYFLAFNPSTIFTKWALVEVSTIDDVPEGMMPFILEGGRYAVFTQKGLAIDNSIFEYIFRKWLPNSQCELAERPHFDILSEKYQQRDPNAEQEVWIPVVGDKK